MGVTDLLTGARPGVAQLTIASDKYRQAAQVQLLAVY